MSAKVDKPSAIEPRDINMSSTSVSGSSTGGPKVSMFAKKSGFVIPKNKLSGSLVPIFREGKTPGGNDAPNEEGSNLVRRKTKWGPDLTQDSAVRRGRALAYQTRIDQITLQLKVGMLKQTGKQDLEVAARHTDTISSNAHIDAEDSELLELERREVIGELLKLNPSFKAPPDYKPLLKVATVPIPVKEHPGYDFVHLIFGSGSETQKRLEKETGAKIQVYGTKASSGEKIEVSPSDGTETRVAYDELSVHISADAYEKVDAAVDLIEFLITSVSGNLATGDNKINLSQTTEVPTSIIFTASVNQGVVHQVAGSVQTLQQGQFQYQGPWFHSVTPQGPVNPQPGYIQPQNSSAPVLNNPMHVQPSPFNPSSVPSPFGPPPGAASGLNSFLQNTTPIGARPQPPLQVGPNSYPPRNFPLPASQHSSAQTNISTSVPFVGNRPPPIVPSGDAGPLISSLPQSLSSIPPGHNRPLIPVGGSSGWSGTPGNSGQLSSPTVADQGPQPIFPQPGFPYSVPPLKVSAAPAVLTMNFPSGPLNQPLSDVSTNHPAGAPSFPSVPLPQLGPTSVPRLVQPPQQLMAAAPITNSSANPAPGSSQISNHMTATSQPTMRPRIAGPFLGTTNFTPIRPPPVTMQNMQHSGHVDFSIQPQHPQNQSSQTVPRPGGQAPIHSSPLPGQMMQSQAPSFRLPMHNSTPHPSMHGYPRPQFGNQMGQAQEPMPAIPFAGNPTGSSLSRLPAFSKANPMSLGPPVLQMGFRNLNPAPQQGDLPGPFPLRPGNPLQLKPNFSAPRGNFMAPNQGFNKDFSFDFGGPPSHQGGQQKYDPFSPTSSNVPQKRERNLGKRRQEDNDPEYEDLMSSVGVK